MKVFAFNVGLSSLDAPKSASFTCTTRKDSPGIRAAPLVRVIVSVCVRESSLVRVILSVCERESSLVRVIVSVREREREQPRTSHRQSHSHLLRMQRGLGHPHMANLIVILPLAPTSGCCHTVKYGECDWSLTLTLPNRLALRGRASYLGGISEKNVAALDIAVKCAVRVQVLQPL